MCTSSAYDKRRAVCACTIIRGVCTRVAIFSAYENILLLSYTKLKIVSTRRNRRCRCTGVAYAVIVACACVVHFRCSVSGLTGAPVEICTTSTRPGPWAIPSRRRSRTACGRPLWPSRSRCHSRNTVRRTFRPRLSRRKPPSCTADSNCTDSRPRRNRSCSAKNRYRDDRGLSKKR